ncbi:MAG TPA: sulfotransferase family protein, partial [Rhodanobacteraceae bacterium]|nr:sulfotransferase family protein [Rhodanobacteraceae bacterium]
GLLASCGLPFEETCLRFHETPREVRSPSATQVRRPLQAGTAQAQRYGGLLDPLRASLGLSPFGT